MLTERTCLRCNAAAQRPGGGGSGTDRPNLERGAVGGGGSLLSLVPLAGLGRNSIPGAGKPEGFFARFSGGRSSGLL